VKKAALILLLALAQDLSGQNTHKLQVTDPARAAEVVASGGRLVADYGGYRLYDVPAAVLNRNLGRARDEYNSILLNAAPLDTTRPEIQALRARAGDFVGKRLHLVQFAGPVQPAWRREVLGAGVQILSYIPQDTYLVYGDSHSIAQLQALAAAAPEIQWEGAFRDDYKTHPTARAGRTDQFAIQLAADPPANAETLKLLDGLKLAPPVRKRRVLDFLDIIVRLRAADLPLVAARPDVISIQPYFTPKKSCERQDQIVAGNLDGNAPAGPGYLAWLAAKGFADEPFAASGFVVDITDSGIDDGTTTPNHFGLYADGQTNAASRVIYSRLEGTSNSLSTLKGCDGHGTLNAHIIGGFDSGTNFPFADGAGFAYGLGVCPFARLGASVVFDPTYWTYPSFSELEAEAYNDGARVNNNSWGDFDGDGVYGPDSQEYDALVRDAQPAGTTYPMPGNQEMVIVFAAGNFGPGGQTIDQPATAKNVITVGGADNVQLFGGEDGCGVGDDQAASANEIAINSSRGPCADGRLKPDLMAPGTHVSGGVIQEPDPGPLGTADPCYTGASVCGGVGDAFYPSLQQFYTASSGTSHSAPCVTGGCALLRQFLINQSLMPPSPAMTKAWLMNSARYMTGETADDTLWSTNQGMGEMDLGVAFDGTPRLLRDQQADDTFTASGQTRGFTGTVANTNLPFRVTLAWTDAPGSTAGAAYNNDLDLTVTVGGQTYLGNVFSGNLSVPGGTADTMDNVESVFCPAGVAGPFTVTVNATSINSIGVPNGSNALTQDFALVVYNAAAAGQPLIVPAGAVLTAENCLPTNGVIDPGETVTVNFALQNSGTVNTTPLVATLMPGEGIDSPSEPAAYGALPPDGVPVSRPFTFTAAGGCGDRIVALVQLQDGVASLGTVAYRFSLGKFLFTTNFSQDFDSVTPPALPSGWTSAVLGGQFPWETTNGVADTLPNSAFAPAATNAGIADLISPSIPMTSASARLTFRQYYDLDLNPYSPGEAYDGGVLEIQVGTNSFTDILAAGGSFVTNGYNTTIAPATASDNPLAGWQAWSGNSGGFVTTIVDLPATAAGSNIVLKWRCATDTGNAYVSVGWWVDAISVTDGGRYVCCDGPWQTAIAEPQLQAGNFGFSFQSASNQTYTVQYKNALTDSAWTNLQTLQGNGQIQFITNVVSASQGFYRIQSP
jgi:hypothetical protein